MKILDETSFRVLITLIVFPFQRENILVAPERFHEERRSSSFHSTGYLTLNENLINDTQLLMSTTEDVEKFNNTLIKSLKLCVKIIAKKKKKTK